ncbi:cellulose biosynthesis protein BcsN [Microvirga terricola]|uniref:Cellulose biosynthesis protein BcsN n=1 Tax=Microvirga terricola TaxID=2719797 RepID=A0ABX0VEN1_9HYPH|nr:cellulose biosynthesis protein BcsN [Microvirga terricola]
MRTRIRDLAKVAALTALVATAAGCAARPEIRYASLTGEVSAAQAIILPPPGGLSVVAVLQRKFINGVSQEVALSTTSRTAGQNAFYVNLINDAGMQSEVEDTLKLNPLTHDRMQEEMEERLPGVPMNISLIYVQNKYGPFGFATGRAASGDVCLYAWQQIEHNQASFFATNNGISIRLRLCAAGATEEQLLRAMYGFTIAAYFPSDIWGSNLVPPPVEPQLGQLGAPIYPTGMEAYSGAVLPPTQPRAPVIRTAPRPRASILEPAALPAAERNPLSGYPLVPPPPSQ